MNRRAVFSAFAVLALMGAAVTFATDASALNADANGWYHTGDAMRTKTVFKVKVYAIGHDMKCLPPSKTKQAVIDADCDKRFIWTMQRDVDKSKIIDALKEAYGLNAYTDAGKINQALAAFTVDLKETKHVYITYSAATKTTTFTEEGGGSATVSGIDFMKGTWKIWLGNIDPPSIGDSLIANL